MATASISTSVRLFTWKETLLNRFLIMSVPRRVSDTKRISEVSKPTNRASAPLGQLDCCYSAAQRGCWAGKKMKEPFVDACSDTAHMYAYHVTPFTSDPLLLGFSLEGIISLYNIEERQWFKQGFYVATAPLKIALEQAGEKKKNHKRVPLPQWITEFCYGESSTALGATY